jgi:NAD-dependent DNA ligase
LFFETLNQKRAKVNQPLYANPRNLAAGTIRQLDPKLVAQLAVTVQDAPARSGDIPGEFILKGHCVKLW